MNVLLYIKVHYDVVFSISVHEAVIKKKSVSCPAGGIKASWAAAFFFSPLFFLVGKYCPFWEEKQIGKKEKKKSPVAPFFSHPAEILET